MRKYRRHSKSGFTLVELIVAMTLTAFFMAACVVLIMPVERIYTQVNEQSKAQLIADMVVNSLRSECSQASVLSADDVMIMSSGASGPVRETTNSTFGNVLRFRRNNLYYETISTNYVLTAEHQSSVRANDDSVVTGNTSSKAIYRMYFVSNPQRTDTANVGHLHYGYFMEEAGVVTPYDFTNPLVAGTYNNYQVAVNFDSIVSGSDGVPDYVNCTIRVMDKDGIAIYTRQTVICF